MYMNKFLTGAVIGGALGALGTVYALANNNQKKQMVRRSRQFIDMANHRVKDML